MITKILGAVTAASPQLKRRMWRGWYEFLASGFAQSDWTFMNYGYETLPGKPERGLVWPPPLSPTDETDRCSIQLYHRVAASVDLTGANVLEVGAGRGGGSSYIARYLHPASVLGIDYSDKAVALSRQRHASVPHLAFAQGDAENLPCPDSTFDAVVNVESSHCYGSMDQFLSEVRRVLKPGGYFLWADMQGKGTWTAMRHTFERAGFVPREAAPITPNVVRGLQAVEARKRGMINRHVPRVLARPFEDFAGVPGTRVYESLRAGNVEYWRAVLQKPMGK